MNISRRTFLKSSVVVLISMGIPVSKVFSGMVQMEINPMNLLRNVEVVKRAIRLNKDEMNNLLCHLTIHLVSVEPNLSKDQYANLEFFLSSIPPERLYQFLCFVDCLTRSSKEFLNITRIHIHLMDENGRYRNQTYDRIISYSENFFQKKSWNERQPLRDMEEKGKVMMSKYFPGEHLCKHLRA
jgi:hypothetical protein